MSATTKHTTQDRPLEQVLDHYGVRFRYREGEQKCKCPIHGDRTPSMQVNLEKQVWHCFTCDKGGGYIQMIMDMEEVDRRNARDIASSKLGIAEQRTGEGGSGISGGQLPSGRRLPGKQGTQRRRTRWFKAGGGDKSKAGT